MAREDGLRAQRFSDSAMKTRIHTGSARSQESVGACNPYNLNLGRGVERRAAWRESAYTQCSSGADGPDDYDVLTAYPEARE